MESNDKLELLRYLIFIRGKLQHLSIELLIKGQDSSQIDTVEKKLAADIDMLRAKVMQSWNGDAQQILSELKALNEKAQDKIRQLRKAVNKAKKLTELVSLLNQGLSLLSGLVI